MANFEHLISIVGVAIPMITIAGSAVAFVWKSYRDARLARHVRFFELMEIIDSKNTIAAKVAAIYQLRTFPEHKDFIIRFCQVQSQNISGDGAAAEALADEMKRTEKFFSQS